MHDFEKAKIKQAVGVDVYDMLTYFNGFVFGVKS